MPTRRMPRPNPLRSLTVSLMLLATALVAPGQTQAQEEPPRPPVETPAPTPAADIGLLTYLPAILVSSGILPVWPPPAASEASANVNLEWRFSNPLLSAPQFNLYFEAGDPSPDVAVAMDQTGMVYDPPTLEPDTDYYWQVVATDTVSPMLQVAGDVWSFRTEAAWLTPDLDAMVAAPAGSFLMGCDRANPSEEPCSYNDFHQDEPVHAVQLDAFQLDKYEVTNQEYKACMNAGACTAPRKRKFVDDDAYALHPVVYVSWWDAVDFCRWEGKRLPTEAEWEKAARGDIDTRRWPWGNEPADCTRLNSNFYRDGDDCSLLSQGTTPVGRYARGASPFGAHDMSGNVFEWVQDKYDVWYYNYTPDVNPSGPPYSRTRKSLWSPWQPPPKEEMGHPVFTIRGGSWRDNPLYLGVAFRHWGHHGDKPGEDAPLYRNDKVGFRCAR